MTATARITAITAALAAVMLSPADPARAQAPPLEVEKSDATKLLQVTNDGGFVVLGSRGEGTIPTAGAGVRLMWYPRLGALRAGTVTGSQWDAASIGDGSVALGLDTRATGLASLALNAGTEATGGYSIAGGYNSMASDLASLAIGDHAVATNRGAVALGVGTVANGNGAVALGVRTVAGGGSSLAAVRVTTVTGDFSVALGDETRTAGGNALAAGFRTQANGNASVAIGTGTVAAGAASVALGSGVTAQGDGSFVFGDRNADHVVAVPANSFAVRAHGGFGFTSGVGRGCDLPPNSGDWSCALSKRVKEGFEDVDGEDVLARLKTVPIQSWRYIGTSARHIGPFAEDFRAAFGLRHDSTKIGQIDANGVALRAVQDLEQRTAELRAENVTLRAETTELRRLEALERSSTSTRVP